MSDRDVISLAYKIRHRPSIDYRDAEPLNREEGDFCLTVERGKATFTFKREFEMEREANRTVSEYIRQWEFSAALEHGPDSFELHSPRPEFKQKNPVSGKVQLAGEAYTGPASVGGTLTKIDYPQSYPAPPSGSTEIEITPNVRTMFDRYMRYFRHKEGLPSMAYFCLTVFEETACDRTRREQRVRKGGIRKEAAMKYDVDLRVLNEIGRLSSQKGGRDEARKSEGAGNPLTVEERRLLQANIALIIRRMAEHEYERRRADWDFGDRSDNRAEENQCAEADLA